MSSGSHHPHYYPSPQTPQYPSQAYPYAPPTSAAPRPQFHSVRAQGASYPSVSYGQQQPYQSRAPSAGGSGASQAWFGGASTGPLTSAQPPSAQTVSYGEATSYGNAGGHRVDRSFGDTRSLGSLAYASSLTPSTSRDTPLGSTEPIQASLPTPATATPERNQHHPWPLVTNSASSAGRSFVSQPSSGSVDAAPVDSTAYLRSVVHGYTPQSGQQTSSTSSANDARLGPFPSSQSITPLPETTAAPEPNLAYSYQPYSASQEAPAPASTYSQHPQPPVRHVQSPAPAVAGRARTPSNSTVQTPAGRGMYPQSARGQSRSHTYAYSQGIARTVEPRVASPFNVGQYHPPRRASPLATTTSQGSPPLPAAAPSIPTTVDPSMVYNPYRESHRPTAQHHPEESSGRANGNGRAMGPLAMAHGDSHDGRSGADDGVATDAGRSPHDGGAISTTLAQASSVLTATGVQPELVNTAPETSVPDGEDMEAQMKMMVEKMREYQARDPSKFAKVWEEVKKGQSVSSGQAHGGVARASPQTQTTAAHSTRSSRSMGGPAELVGSIPAQPTVAATHHGPSADRRTDDSAPQAVPHANTSNIQSGHQDETMDVGTDQVTQHAPTMTRPAAASGTQALFPASIPADNTPSGQGTARDTTTGPSATPKGNVYWLESNKASLAIIAANTLMSYPQNAGRVISSSQIREILDQHPSYVQLCEALEGWGFWLDRSSFAKVLVAALNEANAPTTEQQPETLQNASAEADTSAGPAHSKVAKLTHVDSAQPAADAQEGSPSAPKERKSRKKKPKSDIFTGLAKTGAELPRAVASVTSKVGSDPAEAVMPSQKPRSRASKASKTSAPSALIPIEAVASDVGVGSTTPQEIAALERVTISEVEVPDQIPKSKRSRKTAQTAFPVNNVREPVQETPQQEQQISSTSTVMSSGPVATSASQRGKSHQKAPNPPSSSERVQPSPAPRPFTKAEASRKRNFSEIVDLTLDPLDDPRYSAGRGTSTPGPSLTLSVPTAMATEQARKQVQTAATSSEQARDFHDSGALMDSLYRSGDLAQPMNKKHALKRSGYDVRTIARDILLATGRHPHLRNLNDHLKVLKIRFAGVSDTTDLSTFQWNLVDPMVPSEESAGDSAMDWTDHMISQAAASSISVEKSHTLPRQSTSVPASPNEGPSGVVDAAASSVRGIPAPGPPHSHQVSLHSSSRERLERASETGSRSPLDDDDGGDVDDMSNGVSRGDEVDVARPGSTSETSVHRPFDQESHQSLAPPDRASALERSPTPGFYTPLGRSPSVVLRTLKRIDKDAGGDDVSAAAAAAAITSIPFSNPHRTFYLPNFSQHMSTKEVEPEPSPPEPAKELPLPVFKCMWPGCQAELHNLGTLRRHVRKLHGHPDAEGAYACLWTTCKGVIDRSLPKKHQKRENHLYSTEELWFSHVNRRHIEAYGWMYGDGPQTLRADQRWKPSELLAHSTFPFPLDGELNSNPSSLVGGPFHHVSSSSGTAAATLESDQPARNDACMVNRWDEGAVLAVLGDGCNYMDGEVSPENLSHEDLSSE